MKRQYQDAENRIDRTMNIVGDIRFRGTTVIEGSLQGNVTGEMIIVTKTGEIIGDLIMEKVECSGRIKGAITAQRLSLGSEAQIRGPLVCEILEVESGARIDCEVMSSSHQLKKKKVDQFVAPTADVIQEVKTKDVKKAGDNVKVEVCEEEKPATEEDAQALPINPSVVIEQTEVSCFFPEGEREKIFRSIVEALKSSKEMIKVVGGPGSGTTTICQKVCEGLDESFEVVRLDNVLGSIKDIFIRIAEALNVTLEKDWDQVDILKELKKNLAAKQHKSKSVVLVLDNSHEMYQATLEGVMKNLSHDYSTNEGILQIFLLGDENLNKHLDPKSISYFQAHPDCAFELRPLSKDETCTYIDFKIGVIQKGMNSDQPIDFPYNSAVKVYTFSQGVIGKIDRIVEEAIELAGKKKSYKIVPKFVKNI